MLALLAALVLAVSAPSNGTWSVLQGEDGEGVEGPAATAGDGDAAEALEEPSEGEEDEEEAPEKLAKLVVTTDASANLVVGLVSHGLLEAEHSLEIEVESLTLRISATAADLPVATWFEDLVLDEDEVREISIPMLETIEAVRKRERREQIFRDLDNGWMWPRRDNGRDLAWREAGPYCEALELGGFENWRLPSIEELETLEAMWSLRPLKIADQILLTSCCLWSSTEGSGNAVWNLDFRFRRAFESNRALSFGLRALCLREMGSEELAEARLAADPKERKRRLKEKRRRLDERKRKRAERAREKAASERADP